MIATRAHKRSSEGVFAFSAQDISVAADFIKEQLKAFGLGHKDVLRNRLAAEEILLNWQETRGIAETFTVNLNRRLKWVTLSLQCGGIATNPLSAEAELGGAMGQQILANLGLGFDWQYRDGRNVVSISQKVKVGLSQLSQVLLAFAAALLLGFLGLALPEIWRTTATVSLLDPLFNTFLGLFSCIVSPMMFLAMVWSIVNIGDTRKLGRIGGGVDC